MPNVEIKLLNFDPEFFGRLSRGDGPRFNAASTFILKDTQKTPIMYIVAHPWDITESLTVCVEENGDVILCPTEGVEFNIGSYLMGGRSDVYDVTLNLSGGEHYRRGVGARSNLGMRGILADPIITGYGPDKMDFVMIGIDRDQWGDEWRVYKFINPYDNSGSRQANRSLAEFFLG